MIALLVLLFLSVLSGAAFLRFASEQGTSQREKALVQAFYNAEEGLNYAYGELAQHDFDWNTHIWQGTTVLIPNSVTSSFQSQGGSFNTDGSYYINDATNPHYFKVITYHELDSVGVPTGITVVHSQGTDPKAITQRTVELRVSKNSMFDYFYFFPSDKTFTSATYDGAGYGKIHVNGKITFSGSPNFTNLAELSTADSAHNGYYALTNSQYSSPLDWDDNDSVVNGIAPLPRDGAPPYSYYLSSDLYDTYAKFNWGDNASVDGKKLPTQLDKVWNWDKYPGDKSASEKPTSFRIDNATLAWLTYTKGSGAILSGDDYTNFMAHPDTFDWEAWKNKPENIALGYTEANADTTGALAQKFWHTWQGDNPTYVNKEWWSDLTYGDDRSDGDLEPVNFLNTKEQASAWQDWLKSTDGTIKKADTGITETKELSEVIKDGSSGAQYLKPIGLDNNSYLNKAKDGGLYIVKGYSPEYAAWRQQILSFTLTIDPCNGEVVSFPASESPMITYRNWRIKHGFTCSTGTPEQVSGLCTEFFTKRNAVYSAAVATRPATSRIWDQDLINAGVINTTQFYNTLHPAGTWYYQSTTDVLLSAKPTPVLDIDVEKLRTYLAATGRSFNGIIYIDNPDYNDTNYDFSVRIKNGGVLPQNGLTVVTPHNIFVQGSFNLDKARDDDPGRSDDAYDNYQSEHGGNPSDYTWKPAALISSQRAIYTVSENFENYIKDKTLSDTMPFKYWDSSGGSSYPYSMTNQTFLNTYFNSGLVSIPQQVTDFLAKYGLSAPAEWTVDNVKQIFDSSKYPDAGTAQSALLSAGETKYESDTENTQPNRVATKNGVPTDVIYNTAMVTPYDPQGYTLERWVGADGKRKKRQITGAFIQLEDSMRLIIPMAHYVFIFDEKGNQIRYYYDANPGYTYKTCYPDGSCVNGSIYGYGGYYNGYFARGYYSPYYSDYWTYATNTYGYEINLANQSSSGSTSSLGVSGMVSWLEIPNNDFCAKCQ